MRNSQSFQLLIQFTITTILSQYLLQWRWAILHFSVGLHLGNKIASDSFYEERRIHFNSAGLILYITLILTLTNPNPNSNMF